MPATGLGKAFTVILPGAPSPSLFGHADDQYSGAFEVQGVSLYRGLGLHALDHPSVICASRPIRLKWPPPPPPSRPPMPMLPPGTLPQFVLAANGCSLGGDAQINLIEPSSSGSKFTSEIMIHPERWVPMSVVRLSVIGLGDLSITHVSGAEPVVRHTTRKPTFSYSKTAFGRLGSIWWSGSDLIVNELSFLLTSPASITERQIGFLVECDGAALGLESLTCTTTDEQEWVSAADRHRAPSPPPRPPRFIERQRPPKPSPPPSPSPSPPAVLASGASSGAPTAHATYWSSVDKMSAGADGVAHSGSTLVTPWPPALFISDPPPPPPSSSPAELPTARRPGTTFDRMAALLLSLGPLPLACGAIVALLVLLRLLASTSASGWLGRSSWLVGRRVTSWLSTVLPASSVAWMNAMVANGCGGHGVTTPRAQYAKVRPTSTTNELSGSSPLPTPQPRPRPSRPRPSTGPIERKETPARRQP